VLGVKIRAHAADLVALQLGELEGSGPGLDVPCIDRRDRRHIAFDARTDQGRGLVRHGTDACIASL